MHPPPYMPTTVFQGTWAPHTWARSPLTAEMLSQSSPARWFLLHLVKSPQAPSMRCFYHVDTDSASLVCGYWMRSMGQHILWIILQHLQLIQMAMLPTAPVGVNATDCLLTASTAAITTTVAMANQRLSLARPREESTAQWVQFASWTQIVLDKEQGATFTKKVCNCSTLSLCCWCFRMLFIFLCLQVESGKQQTNFSLSITCQFCWQLDLSQYRCSNSTSCRTVACPRKRYNATCQVLDHVHCLGIHLLYSVSGSLLFRYIHTPPYVFG